MKILTIVLLAVCLLSGIAGTLLQAHESKGAEPTWAGIMMNSKATSRPTVLLILSAVTGFASGVLGVVTAA